jgi:hypothetical protein
MAGGKRNQVRETLQRNGQPVVHKFRNRFAQWNQRRQNVYVSSQGE